MAFRLCDLHLIWPRFTQQDWLQVPLNFALMVAAYKGDGTLWVWTCSS